MNLTNEQITNRRKDDQPDAAEIQVYRDYASGKHPEILTNKQQKLLHQRATHTMVDNVLGLVLKTTSSRLKLTEWTVDGEEPANIADGSKLGEQDVDGVKQFLASLWLMNRVKRLQYEVHYAALRDGNSAVSLSYRNGRIHLARESWWDGTSGLYIAYGDDGEYEFAVNEWDQRETTGKTTRRRTVYEPGALYRWQQEGQGWKPYERGDIKSEEILLRGASDTSVPLAIPIVHFPNGTVVTESAYGESDIKALLALQDDLNATQRDISAAALMSAFQRIAIFGVNNPKDVAIEPGGFFGSDNPAAKLQVVEPGDTSQLTSTHAYKRESMSIDSGTPMHAITGDWPSGAALLRADMPQIEKVELMADVVGPQWTMVAHRSMEYANAFGGLALNENVPITSVFAPAERIDELTELEIQQARAELWRTLSDLPREAMLQTGYVTEPVADQIIAEKQAQREVYLSALNDGSFGQDYDAAESAA